MNIQELLGSLSTEIASIVQERNAERADNATLRSRILVLEALLRTRDEELHLAEEEIKALRDKQDAGADIERWRAEVQAEGVVAAHKREVQGLQRQIASRQSAIERISERRDFWYNTAQNDGREHAKALDRLAKTDGVLMELCQELNLDPTGDPVAELRARIADAPRLHCRAIDGHWEDPRPAAKAAPYKPIDVAQAVWPGAWSKDGDSLILSLADTSSLIHAEIEAQFGTHGGCWHVRLNNRGLWTLLAKSSGLADALILARSRMRQTVADLAKGVG